MVFPIEILSLGSDLYDEIRPAINHLNSAQNEFHFAIPPDRLKDFGLPFVQTEYLTNDVYERLREYREVAKGNRPYLIGVVNGGLKSKKLGNLFGSHEASEGLAVFTLKNCDLFSDSTESYTAYYLTRYALSFLDPELKAHEETRSCFFDKKISKNDLRASLSTGGLCDECLNDLQTRMNPEIYDAISRMGGVLKGFANTLEKSEIASAYNSKILDEAQDGPGHESHDGASKEIPEKELNEPYTLVVSPPKQRLHVVILVHGIRTRAFWVNKVVAILREPGVLKAEPVGYDYFDLLRFWFPFWTRRFPEKIVHKKIQDVMALNEGADFSIIAHSFGTYLTDRILRNNPLIKLKHLILCGSVLPRNSDLEIVKKRIGAPKIINEVGLQDIWPVIAKAVSWGYGHSGTFGFQSPYALDRYHEFRHSDFFKDDFIHTFWRKLLIEDDIEEGAVPDKPQVVWWVRLASIFPVKTVLMVGLIWFFVEANYLERFTSLFDPKSTSTLCMFTGGPLNGMWKDYSPKSPLPVGTPCQDGVGSIGRVVIDLARNDSDVSTICMFTGGPRNGTWKNYSPMSPIQVGASCQDGVGSTGSVIR